MGSNMFEGFMEGFTKTLGTGIMENEKARLQAERDAARDLRAENFARFQITNSNEQNAKSLDARRLENMASLGVTLDEGAKNRQATVDAASTRQDHDARMSMVEQGARLDEAERARNFTREENKKNRASDERRSANQGKTGEDPREQKLVQYLVTLKGQDGKPLYNEESAAKQVFQAKSDPEGTAASMAVAMMKSQDGIPLSQRKTMAELYSSALEMLNSGQRPAPAEVKPFAPQTSPSVGLPGPGMKSSHSTSGPPTTGAAAPQQPPPPSALQAGPKYPEGTTVKNKSGQLFVVRDGKLVPTK